METLKPPGHIDLHSGNVADRWRKWKNQFQVYFDACELSGKSKPTQKAIFLHAAGPEALEISETFTWNANEDQTDYTLWIAKFDAYSEPRKNVVFERYEFWSRNQREGESIDTWVTELRLAAKKCEFGAEESSMLRDKIVFGIKDVPIKERLLRDPELTLQKTLDICRAAESSRQHVRAMTSQEPEVNIIKHGRHKYQHAAGKQPLYASSANSSAQISKCRFCGKSHPKGRCPAYGKTCGSCGFRNHFAAVCQHGRRNSNVSDNNKNNFSNSSNSKNSQWKRNKRPVNLNTIDDEGDCDIDSLFIGSLNSKNDKWQETLTVGGLPCTFKLDTGADANILPEQFVDKIQQSSNIKQTKQPLRAFGGSRIMPLGTIQLDTFCARTGLSCSTSFFVTDTNDIPILGKHSCEEFKLIQRIFTVDSVETIPNEQCLFDAYSDVFRGLGKYEEPYTITVDPAVTPVIQRSRKVPFAKLPTLKASLERLERQGVVASVDRPTDWVHNLVITDKKDGTLRICLDPKPLNTAIKRETHTIPTAEDVQAQLCGKSLFTVVDMKDSYWQVCLDDESSYLCTFHTPWGRKRFLRMPFGISSASEVLQKRNEAAFFGINGAHIIADDLIIAAKDDKEHDRILHEVMQRAREKNIRFNQKKLQFKTSQVAYMGNVISATGLQPCPKKVEAICNMPLPTDKKALQRLLGMIRYLAQFIPNESSLTAPLRSLLKKDSHWHWSHEHSKAVQQIKEAIARPTMLHFFDVTKPVLIQTDASQSGLGSCILQEGCPIAFASRALTSAEENYSQIEKELLAICFSCAKFHQYVYGRKVEMHTDHRPLETIFKKPLANAAPRLQRMLLQLQRYDLIVNYVPGKLMYIADTLSRAYVEGDPTCGAAEDIEVMVHQLLDSLPMTQARRQQFRDSISNDPTMRRLQKTVSEGWPKSRKSAHSDLQSYWNIRDQIHEADGLLFNGDRVLVPPSLRSEMLSLIHESHLGVQKCQANAREVLFWPNMLSDIKMTVSKCEICTALRPDQPKEPLLSHQIPDRPWQKLAADIMTWQNKDYLVVTDYYSKFPEIAVLENKSANCVILHLKSMMARHGIPEQICTDNNPFNSAEFLRFAKTWNFTLITSSPTYPQSNGQAENIVKTIKQLLTKASLSGRDPYIALLEYRNTPVAGMTLSPAQMLMSRRLRSKLPSTAQQLRPAVVNAKPQLANQKRKQEYYHNRGARHLPTLCPGDSVHMRKGKLWKPAVVVKLHHHPRSYIVACEGAHYRRNRRHLLHTPCIPAPAPYHYMLEDDFQPAVPAMPQAADPIPPAQAPEPIAAVPRPALSQQEDQVTQQTVRTSGRLRKEPERLNL